MKSERGNLLKEKILEKHRTRKLQGKVAMFVFATLFVFLELFPYLWKSQYEDDQIIFIAFISAAIVFLACWSVKGPPDSLLIGLIGACIFILIHLLNLSFFIAITVGVCAERIFQGWNSARKLEEEKLKRENTLDGDFI